MKTYYITPPNTCCLVINLDSIVYTQNFDGPIEAVDEASFEEFLTPDDALIRAKEIDPSYPADNILGYLTVTLVSTSDLAPVATAGDNVTMSIEVECADSVITYEWKGPDGAIIPDATSSSLTLTKVTSEQAGYYTGIANAENAKGQTGVNGAQFHLSVVYSEVEE